MKIILHGILEQRFGREFEIATRVPGDAIEGLSRQLQDWPRDLLVSVPGFETDISLRSETDVDEIHLVPAMFGGGGVGKIVIGAALIAVAVFVPGLGTIAGMAVSAMLFSVGASMMLMGISELLMTAPTTDKSNDPDPSKYLGINKNTAAIGTLITMAYGRIKLNGHWLSLQSDSSDLVTASFPVTTS